MSLFKELATVVEPMEEPIEKNFAVDLVPAHEAGQTRRAVAVGVIDQAVADQEPVAARTPIAL